MFYSLTGKLVRNDANSCVIDVGGVAFRCTASMQTLANVGQVGQTATLYTYLSVREDALELFGFYREDELDAFRKLIAVSGVGAKVAVAILSVLTPDALALAVANGDVKAITRAQGVGAKLAQRVVLELKGKLTAPENAESALYANAPVLDSKLDEAVSALEFLGYSHQESIRAVQGVDPSGSVEDVIRKALGALS